MSALNEGLDRINGSYPIRGPAAFPVEIVLNEWIVHYNCVGEVTTAIFIASITIRKSAENVVRFS
jgi:hypothetical protein